MSIKDLFDNYKNNNFAKSETIASSSVLLESKEYITAKKEEFDRFIPDIDFSSASNFAKFGSAEMYYDTAFKRIYQEYPYDGTLAEKQEFENESSYLDRYVFNNLYPRTNGYIVFSNQGTDHADHGGSDSPHTNPTVKEYILIHGGPHTASSGMIGSTLHSKFDDSVSYKMDKRRGSNLEVSMASGSTIEFWLKKQTSMDTQREELFDLHNGEASGSTYGRLTLYLTSSHQSLHMTLISGSDGFQDVRLMTGSFDGNWNHHAITVITSSAGTQVNVYKNNELINSFVSGGVSDISGRTFGLKATIGSMARDTHAGLGDVGFNKLSASMDEFRYWKTERSHKQIDNCWFRPIGGGTDDYDSNTDLGVYYKFNEGTVGNSVYDAKVLDYSGRLSDGMWVGYKSGARSSGSAMVESGVTLREFRDPIIYSAHPEVSSSKAQYMTTGSLADTQNNALFYRLFPSWMQEEDEQQSRELKKLSHIIGSYFDTIWHQTNEISKLKHDRYVSGSNKAYPFSRNILLSRGFSFPEFFSNAASTEMFLNKDSNEIYEKNIKEVRDTIYHNINTGLLSIYKSKGTMKSFRNFFRSMGISREIVVLNKYADDSTHLLKNNYYLDNFDKRYVNFNTEGNTAATIYTMSSSAHARTYVAGSPNYSSTTLESNIILPRKNTYFNSNLLEVNFLSSSVMGFHTAHSSDPNLITWTDTTDYEMKVYVIKEKNDRGLFDGESHRVKFGLVSSQLPFDLTSSYFNNQYDDNKWNLAVKIKHENYPRTNIVTGSLTSNYIVEFYGVEADGIDKKNYFSLTSSLSSHNIVASDKRFYVGAHRKNFSGSLLQETDIKMGGISYWNSYMPNHIIDEHAFDIENYGINNPEEEDIIGFNSHKIPRADSLVFRWAFDTLTGSNAAGNIKVYDFSSGSSTTRYGSMSNIVDRMYEGYGSHFKSSDNKLVDKNYIQVARRRHIDNLYTADSVIVEKEGEEFFFQDQDTNDVVFSFEKSLYGTISAEMINMVGTSVDFNSLIGRPDYKYHDQYTSLNILRDRFFDQMEKEPDFEKYVSFYKWIDASISEAIRQLIPAGDVFTDNISDVLESHIFERNKYLNQTNLLVNRAFIKQNFSGPARGVQELLYNWPDGGAPTGSGDKVSLEELAREDLNCLWHRDRREKEGTRPIATGTSREAIRSIKTNHSLASYGRIFTKTDGTTYLGSTYALRKLAKPYNLSLVSQKTIHGGVNYSTNKNKLLMLEALAPHGSVASVPQNVITIGTGKGSGLEIPQDCDDISRSAKSFIGGKRINEKTFWSSQAKMGKFTGDEYLETIKGERVIPYSFVEDVVHTGYNEKIKSYFNDQVVVTNIHPDITYITNDVPMQGPFTETHVGGHQSRHVPINCYAKDKSLIVKKHLAAQRATGSLRFDVSKLSIGDNVKVTDSDGTFLQATFNKFNDLQSNQFRSADYLARLISLRLDIDVSVTSGASSLLSMNQRAWGTDGNKTMVSSTSNITASGFGGGTNPSSTVDVQQNLDSTLNRPEAWAIVPKTHPVLNDTDGALGFVGPDYGGSYPNKVKPWAIKFRDEHAKRPVNIRNIQHSKNSSEQYTAGNYHKGYEFLILNKSDQKRWFRDAYDSNLHLPTSISSVLPETTNYMTLISQSPFVSGSKSQAGNVFGNYPSNRQPDGEELTPVVPFKTEVYHSGTYAAGTYSRSSFTVTGAFNPQYPTGSFYVLAPAHHGKDDILQIPQSEGGGNHYINYSIATNEGAGVNFVIQTGSSDTVFYSNLTASLASNNNMAATYQQINGTWARGLKVRKRNGSFLSGSLSPGDITSGSAWSFSCWLYLDGNTGNSRGIYNERSSVGSNIGREVIIDTAGRLRLYVNYVNHFESATTNHFDQYYIENFTSNYAGKSTHIVWTHSGSVNSTSVGHLYINGKRQTLITNAGGANPGCIRSTPNEPNAIYIASKGEGATTTLSNGDESFIDEIIILRSTASQEGVDVLYNNARRLDVNRSIGLGSSIIPSAAVGQYWSFESDANVNDEGTIDCLGGLPIDLKINNDAGCFEIVSGSSGAVYGTPPSAIFRLTGTIAANQYSAPIRVPTTGASNAYFSPYGIYGGGNFGAIAGNYISIGHSSDHKHFHFVATSSANSSPNYYISNTGSSAQIWHALSSSIKSALGTVRITRADTGLHSSQFFLTRSVSGSVNAYKLDVAEYGTSFTDHSDHQTGTATTGARDGHTLTFSYGGVSKNFIFDDDGSSDSGDNIYIQTTGSHAAIRHYLAAKIKEHTEVDTVNGYQLGSYNRLQITASNGTNYTVTRNHASYRIVSTTPGAFATYAKDIVITVPRTDLTQSTHEFNTRFSAPGGPEIQTDGFLDVAGKSFSAYNALPYRNLTVRGSGSGEDGTIRMLDHAGYRRGLRSLRAIPMGRFGVDSQYGEIVGDFYVMTGSFHKVHRNTSYKYLYGTPTKTFVKGKEIFTETIITGSRNDNDYISTQMPRSDFQYSWIVHAISGSDWRRLQNITGYAPKNGLVFGSLKHWTEDRGKPTAGISWIGEPESPPDAWIPAINFPTGSTIYLGPSIAPL